MSEIRRVRRFKPSLNVYRLCFDISFCFDNSTTGWQWSRVIDAVKLRAELEKERELALSSKIKFATEKISICPINEAAPGSEECLFCCNACISYYLEEFFGCDGFLLCWYRRDKKNK